MLSIFLYVIGGILYFSDVREAIEESEQFKNHPHIVIVQIILVVCWPLAAFLGMFGQFIKELSK